MIVERFANKVAIVTGAGSGIGRATAIGIAAGGGRVVVGDLDEARAEETAALLPPGAAVAVVGDLTDDAVADRLVAAARALGPIDILVNCAGFGGGRAAFGSFEPTLWNRIQEVNLTGPFLLIGRVIDAMVERGSGSIVNVASVAGLVGEPGIFGYSAAKAGLVNLTRALALHYARSGVRVNCVCPGVTDTNFLVNVRAATDAAEIFARYAEMMPIGRLARADEVAEAILFLASDAASFCVGVALPVDGGWTAG
ncbi:SDR family NAD(P)-dependent oxidoreductase [Sphingomonas bacterium]|uniref:SDR family NAD(P)-dependent oxidoreductase n=1 Tax=Sphingomonas bacterium TaxID=1895847 RepID=UPI001575ABB6|nr:glucose 1-dehydrogenase [Sphingomonas bacterium]